MFSLFFISFKSFSFWILHTKKIFISIIPISIYFKGSIVKIELGLGKGKKLYDKRQDIAKKDAERRMQQALRLKEKS